MRTANPTLTTYLAANNVVCVADLFTVDLASYLGVDAARGMAVNADGNTQCKWTTGDTDLNGFSSAGPALKRGHVRQSYGAEINTMDLTVSCAGWIFPNGKTLAKAALEGAFDGSHIKVERLFMPTWGDVSLGSINWFEGSVAAPDIASLELKLQFKSDLEKLNVPMPRRLYQPSCPYALFDGACGVAKTVSANYWNGAAQVGSTAASIVVVGGYSLNQFRLGTVKFTSGALAGLSRMVTDSVNSGGNHVLALAVPFPAAPINGDTCVFTMGCDKQITTCTTVYNNANRFGGFPFVPKPESVR